MFKRKQKISTYTKLMLCSLITILLVTIRIVMDITSFIPAVSGNWNNLTWAICSLLMFIGNVIAIIFTFLEYKIASDKHRMMLIFVLIILFFTLCVEISWGVLDLLRSIDVKSSQYINLVNEFQYLTIISIACELVAIPCDILSTYFISKGIR